MKEEFFIDGYRFEIRISEEQDSNKHYQKEISCAVIKDGDWIVRFDNCHPKTNGDWPIHIHKRNRVRHFFIGAELDDVIHEFSVQVQNETGLDASKVYTTLKEKINPENFINTDKISDTIELHDEVEVYARRAGETKWEKLA